MSTPNTPSGPSSGETNTSYSYSTGGSSSSLGHSVQYRFDWDDGTYSSWSSSTTASHSWSSAGTYYVKAQARCASDTSVVSDWSSYKTVTQSSSAELCVSYSSWTAPSGGGTQSISVTNCGNSSTLSWSVTDNADWLSESPTDGTTPGSFTITASANNTGSTRTGTVTASASGVSSKTITVTQPPAMFSIQDCWWTDIVDCDGDGYSSIRTLHIDVDVDGGPVSVYAAIYNKPSTGSSYEVFVYTACHTISGYTSSDEFSVRFGFFDRNSYDYKVEIYACGTTSPLLDVYYPADDLGLNDELFEDDTEDTKSFYIYIGTDLGPDNDLDGYHVGIDYRMDVDVSCDITQTVTAKLYYRENYPWSLWNGPVQTATWDITGNETDYVCCLGSYLPHGIYDFKIEVYATINGISTKVVEKGPDDNSNMNDMWLEYDSED